MDELQLSLSFPLNQVPKISVQIFEDGDSAIRLLLGIASEFDIAGHERPVVTPEIVSMEKQEDAAAGLVSDTADLLRSSRLCEQHARAAGSRRSYQHPALARTEVSVFEELESEDIGVEGDRFIVVANHNGDVGEDLQHSLSFYGSARTRRARDSGLFGMEVKNDNFFGLV